MIFLAEKSFSANRKAKSIVNYTIARHGKAVVFGLVVSVFR